MEKGDVCEDSSWLSFKREGTELGYSSEWVRQAVIYWVVVFFWGGRWWCMLVSPPRDSRGRNWKHYQGKLAFSLRGFGRLAASLKAAETKKNRIRGRDHGRSVVSSGWWSDILAEWVVCPSPVIFYSRYNSCGPTRSDHFLCSASPNLLSPFVRLGAHSVSQILF